MISKDIFHAMIGENIYLISTLKSAPTEDGRTLEPGNATPNSYLVIGEEKALLFDLAVDEQGVYEYAKDLAQKEVMVVLSHGHFDHVYHLNKLEEVWIHKEDEFLLIEGMPMLGASPCPSLYYLQHDDIIELGNRSLKVIHLPGHTPGSILLLDDKNKFLLSGDTGARRLLLGVSGEVNIEDLCERLEQLKQEDFEVMFSAHDRCALPKSHIDLMLGVLRGEVKSSYVKHTMPMVGTFINQKYGKENEICYFDVTRQLQGSL